MKRGEREGETSGKAFWKFSQVHYVPFCLFMEGIIKNYDGIIIGYHPNHLRLLSLIEVDCSSSDAVLKFPSFFFFLYLKGHVFLFKIN